MDWRRRERGGEKGERRKVVERYLRGMGRVEDWVEVLEIDDLIEFFLDYTNDTVVLSIFQRRGEFVARSAAKVPLCTRVKPPSIVESVHVTLKFLQGSTTGSGWCHTSAAVIPISLSVSNRFSTPPFESLSSFLTTNLFQLPTAHSSTIVITCSRTRSSTDMKRNRPFYPASSTRALALPVR